MPPCSQCTLSEHALRWPRRTTRNTKINTRVVLITMISPHNQTTVTIANAVLSQMSTNDTAELRNALSIATSQYVHEIKFPRKYPVVL